MKLTFKQIVITSFVLIGSIPFLIMGIRSYIAAKEALHQETFAKLEAINTIKTGQLKKYFDLKFSDLEVLGLSEDVQTLVHDLIEVHTRLETKADEGFPSEDILSQAVYKRHDPYFKTYVDRYAYYDLFVICARHGHVMYSAARESDLGANLSAGRLKDSGLGRLWKKVVTTKKAQVVDMEPYAPSDDAPAMFLGAPVFDEDGEMLSVIAVQISDKAINAITGVRDGMGRSGESYLVGADHLMRSDSFLDPRHHSLLASFADPVHGSVNTDAAKAALSGKSGVDIIKDYDGKLVLSAYGPIKLGDIEWALISEMDLAEVDAPTDALFDAALLIGVIIMALIVLVAVLVTNSIVSQIVSLVTDIDEAAGQVASASDQISNSSQQLAEGAQEQAASVEEVNSSLTETRGIVEQNAQSAREADILSKDADESARSGYEHIKELTTAMEEINDSSRQIANIIKTIDEIAFQTNLLALNAAVEAARAGEHGLGFAVVAEEVRSLAQRSAEAAKDTTIIIERSIDQIKKGDEITDRTNKAFEDILDKVKKTGDITAEIALASQDQATGIKQIDLAMGQVGSVTQTMAANSEESAAASEEMSAQAATMRHSIAQVARLFGIKA